MYLKFLFSIFLVLNSIVFANIYTGFGPSFYLQQNPSSELNKNSVGLSAEIESRYFCNYWFGIGLEYSSLEKQDDLLSNQDYFTSFFSLNPRFRYVLDFIGEGRYGINPYININLHLGMVRNTDQLGSISLGSGIGAGITSAFDVDDNCFMVDFGLNYSGYNNIYKVDGRRDFNAIRIYFVITYRL